VGVTIRELARRGDSPELVRVALDIDDELTPAQKQRIHLERVLMDDQSYEVERVRLSSTGGAHRDVGAEADVVVDRVVACSPRRDGRRTWVVAGSDGYLHLRPTAATHNLARDRNLHDMNEDSRRLEALSLQPRPEDALRVTQVTPDGWSRRAIRLRSRLGDQSLDLYVWRTALIKKLSKSQADLLIYQARERWTRNVHGPVAAPAVTPTTTDTRVGTSPVAPVETPCRRLQDLPHECLDKIFDKMSERTRAGQGRHILGV
jgi:hypothetical protein